MMPHSITSEKDVGNRHGDSYNLAYRKSLCGGSLGEHTHAIRIKVSSTPQFRMMVPRVYKRANTKIDPRIVGTRVPTSICGTLDASANVGFYK
jgi:hypothetical protein